MAMIINLNTGPVFKSNRFGDLPCGTLLSMPLVLRRKSMERAKAINNYVARVLETVPLVNGFKYTFVDVKVQHVKAGKATETTGPHIDFRLREASADSFELNHLWCSTLGTHFSTARGAFTIPQFKTVAKLGQDYQAEPLTWYTYDRHQLHWGPTAEEDTQRLFIRVSQTMENYR